MAGEAPAGAAMASSMTVKAIRTEHTATAINRQQGSSLARPMGESGIIQALPVAIVMPSPYTGQILSVSPLLVSIRWLLGRRAPAPRTDAWAPEHPVCTRAPAYGSLIDDGD